MMRSFRFRYCFLLVFSLIEFGISQSTYECGEPDVTQSLVSSCPVGWVYFEQKCYLFSQYPYQSKAAAKLFCVERSSLLLRVDNVRQMVFLNDYLSKQAIDQSVPFWTSGRLDDFQEKMFVWEDHPEDVKKWRTEITTYWLKDPPRKGDNIEWPRSQVEVVLTTNAERWGWQLINATRDLPFICEARSSSLASILESSRDFNYGIVDLNMIKRSPCFQMQPADRLVFQNPTSGSLDTARTIEFACEAYANPPPSYKWYKILSDGVRNEINPLAPGNERFGITNGVLRIYDVKSDLDSGRYSCEAKNELGGVLSRHASLNFGILPTFPKQNQEEMVKKAYEFGNIECKLSDNSSPRDVFYFTFFHSIPGNTPIEVRADNRDNLFVSQATGRLYFSEFTSTDAGTYYCLVGTGSVYTGISNRGPLIKLTITSGSGDIAAVMVADGFPAVIPKSPQRGQKVRLECIGYGPITKYLTPLKYTWKRSGNLKIPGKALYPDPYNRVIVIPDAQIEDSGTYSCRIQDGERRDSEWKSLDLKIDSGPFFVIHPADVFVDLGQDALFKCKARGNDPLTYEWYKNGVPIGESDADKSRTFANTTAVLPTLLIKGVQFTDNAAYGCRVKNNLDIIYGYAELRVLNLAPTFNKNPSASYKGIIGSELILPCRAEGAPEPTKVWKKDGADLSVNQADSKTKLCPSGTKRCQLVNGNLMINPVEATDEGNYQCRAENPLGVAENNMTLAVVPTMRFEVMPLNRKVLVNSTIDLPCQVLGARNLDINYAWNFEGYDLLFGRYDYDRRRYEATGLVRDYKRDFGTLRIQNIQFDYEGNFTCVVRTPLGKIEKAAYLRVMGPPGPCAGVTVPPSINSTEFEIIWRRGSVSHENILTYKIELQHDGTTTWFVHKIVDEGEDITERESAGDLGKRKTVIGNLPFFQSYRARVIATNRYGNGIPSPPSQSFTTVVGKPSGVPMNLTGGGGKAKTLVVEWAEIPLQQRGGPEFSYEIRYKKPEDKDYLFEKNVVGYKITNRNQQQLARTSPVNFLQHAIVLNGERNSISFKLYNVSIRGANVKTSVIDGVSIKEPQVGDWSSSVLIRSSEVVPTTAPKDIRLNSYNSTAIEAFWSPPDNYDGVQGDILGYRIVYWQKPSSGCEVEDNSMKIETALRLTVFGKSTDAMIVGLLPDTFYCVAVQLFNSAGDSPESSWKEQTTNRRAPNDYPTNVQLHTTDVPNTIRVTWNGIIMDPSEEGLDGYAVRKWHLGDPVTMYEDLDAGMRTEVTLTKLVYENRYNIRVFGYSAGGNGTMSSPMLQFMLYAAERCAKAKGRSYEGPDIRYEFICSGCLIRPSVLLPLTLSLVVLALQHLPTSWR